MLRSTASKVMWVGRATVFLVGLAVILALLFGAATTALGKNGNPFILGKGNVATKVSALVKRGAGPALRLQVGSGPPLAVNSGARVANLNAAFAGRADSAARADSATNAQNADKLDGKDESAFLGKTEKAADADKLDNLDSSAFGIRTEHNRQMSSECDTPNVNNNCAPITVVVPSGKTYHVSIWSSLSWTGTSTAQDMEYCVYRTAVGGGAQGSHCVTPFSVLNRITLPANQRAAASVSGETTLGPGTWELATVVTPLASQVLDSDRNWIITKVMIRDASAPAPTIQ